MAKRVRVGSDEVLVHFAELEDPRSEVNRLHSLESVVIIAPGGPGCPVSGYRGGAATRG